MRAGDLDRRITLQRYGLTRDDKNRPSEAWAEIGKRWASKRDVSDAERERAAQVGASVSTRWQLRSDSLTRTITAADRLVHDGKVYSITGIKEIGRREGVELTTVTGNDPISAGVA